MPKKFKGENSKAAVAKARKADLLNEKLAAKEKAEEDALWEDDNKSAKKKQQRKDDKEKKREDENVRRLESRRLLEEEEVAVQASTKLVKATRMTAAQIKTERERILAAEAAERKQQQPKTHLDEPLDVNPNIALAELEAAGDTSARNVEDAIGALSVKDPALDKHPERRMKAAYNAFEEVRLPVLRAENPNLRMSQLKQILKKEWSRSLDNPLNQRTANYNAK